MVLKKRQLIGKYRVDGRLAEGGFAAVYRAYDTIEGIHVALKVPFKHLMTPEATEDFKREVRITAQLDHPNILQIKNADFIDGKFVIASRLGTGSLDERMRKRTSFKLQMLFAEQMLEALAFAHGRKVLHCDIKPDNFILFDPDQIRLADFGIARILQRTVNASGSGTVGYVAPEQAMGRPSFRSDCFSLGVILYRMFSGALPEWPFKWPPPGLQKLRRVLHRDMIAMLRRAMEVDERRRFEDATQMLAVFKRNKPRALAERTRKRRKVTHAKAEQDWDSLRQRTFKRHFGAALGLRLKCSRCSGPVSESMQTCPWCSAPRKILRVDTAFPGKCGRCRRGMKLDWRYCPWCYGAAQGPTSNRKFTDVRYTGRCAQPGCSRRSLMPFMRYCPWCRAKVKRRWKIKDSSDKCGGCGWGVVSDYWCACPWCARKLK